MSVNTKAVTTRLTEEEHSMVRVMAEASHRSINDVIKLGIRGLWVRHEAAVAEGRERARRAQALIEELKTRLGDDLLDGAEQVGFSDDGPIAVQVGAVAYVLTDSGAIVAQRETKGRAEMSVVPEDGALAWMAAAPAAPGMN